MRRHQDQAAIVNEDIANKFARTFPNGPRRVNVNNPEVQLFGIPGIPDIPWPSLPDLPSLPIPSPDDIRSFLGIPSFSDLLNFLNPQPGESEECRQAKEKFVKLVQVAQQSCTIDAFLCAYMKGKANEQRAHAQSVC